MLLLDSPMLSHPAIRRLLSAMPNSRSTSFDTASTWRSNDDRRSREL
jgi:hypothetical protein